MLQQPRAALGAEWSNRCRGGSRFTPLAAAQGSAVGQREHGMGCASLGHPTLIISGLLKERR